MCDYSLEAVKSVKAEQGVTYKVGTFNSMSSKGFKAEEDCAACVPADTVLRIHVPEDLQYKHGVTAIEDVIFGQRDMKGQMYGYRDGVTFENGAFELVQVFPIDTVAAVMVLGGGKEDATLVDATPAPHPAHAFSFYG